jgi:hypothetical protein
MNEQTKPAARHTPAVVTAARVLCKRAAEECNVNADDSWAVYADIFLEDAQAALAAAEAAQTPTPDHHMRLLSGLWRWGLPATNRAGQSLHEFIESVEDHMRRGMEGKL